MKKHFTANKGFTLIELVLYMGLFGILSSVFVSLLNNQLGSETTASTDENGKYLLTRLSYDISNAQSILVPATAGSQSASLQLKINNINYLYALDANGNFQIKDTTDNLGPYNLNDYDATVSGLLFKRLGSVGGKNTLQVNFTVMSTTKQKTGQSKSLQTTIGTR